MCGLSYIKLDNKDVRWPIRSTLLLLSQRGRDTWGYLAINRSENSFLHEKSIGNISKFRNIFKIRRLQKLGFNEIILQSRYATNGYTGVFQNIQPIILNDYFFLVHNGLILNMRDDKKLKTESSFSDSYNLANTLLNMSDKEHEKYLNERKGEITTIFTKVHEWDVSAYTNVGGIYQVEARGFKIFINELPQQGKIHKILYGDYKITKIPLKKVVKIN
jgi:glutamine phosphoribosylpyrophosphate amidotransferase